ncbi:hypothetical protein B0H14DRAFT_3868799, partial [Mycena olivaceomarginata]
MCTRTTSPSTALCSRTSARCTSCAAARRSSRCSWAGGCCMWTCRAGEGWEWGVEGEWPSRWRCWWGSRWPEWRTKRTKHRVFSTHVYPSLLSSVDLKIIRLPPCSLPGFPVLHPCHLLFILR